MLRFTKSFNQPLNNWDVIIVNNIFKLDMFDETSITKFPEWYDN